MPVTSANRIPYLQTKKADLVISTLGKNPEREKVIDFSAAYAPSSRRVFAAEEPRVKTLADLAGKTVGRHARRDRGPGARQGRAAQRRLKRFEDNNATISAFVAGQVQTDRHQRRRSPAT